VWLRRLLVLAAIGGCAYLVVERPLSRHDRAPVAGFPKQIRQRVHRMSTRQKIDRVLLLGFSGRGRSPSLLKELRKDSLGGVYLGAANWSGTRGTRALVNSIRAAGSARHRLAPLIVTSQQGGGGRTFGQLPPRKLAISIGARAVPKLAEAWSLEAGRALHGLGVDLNLFPAVDVAIPASPYADLSFGDDPAVVRALARAALIGCQKARIGCAPGRFPGLGGASQDTDVGPATVGSPEETILADDLAPYRGAISAGAPAIVLSNAFYAAFDAATPASLSPEIATKLLRQRLRFRGVAITDDLGAGAIGRGSGAKAAPQAIAAGADLVLIERPGQGQAARAAMTRALADGSLEEGRLDIAAARVLQLTLRLGRLR
jgi:beta-N-acetylhexosaminidase